MFDIEGDCEELLLLIERESHFSEEDVEFGGEGGFIGVDSTYELWSGAVRF